MQGLQIDKILRYTLSGIPALVGCQDGDCEKEGRIVRSQIDIFDEIIVDNFAGGGGASTGIELAAGRPVAIAINHDPDAILLHNEHRADRRRRQNP